MLPKKPYSQYTKEDWDSLLSIEWRYILKKYPQYDIYCDWEKISGFHWSAILQYRPNLVQRCNWEKFTDVDWYWLLMYFPQLKKYKKLAELKNN